MATSTSTTGRSRPPVRRAVERGAAGATRTRPTPPAHPNATSTAIAARGPAASATAPASSGPTTNAPFCNAVSRPNTRGWLRTSTSRAHNHWVTTVIAGAVSPNSNTAGASSAPGRGQHERRAAPRARPRSPAAPQTRPGRPGAPDRRAPRRRRPTTARPPIRRPRASPSEPPRATARRARDRPRAAERRSPRQAPAPADDRPPPPWWHARCSPPPRPRPSRMPVRAWAIAANPCAEHRFAQ